MKSHEELRLGWASLKDEWDIRQLAGSVAMPGAVSVRFAREPNYYLGTSIMGEPCQVLIARRVADGRLAGMGCRAERSAYVNGREARVGYIGQIRVAAGFRGTWLVHRGAEWFKNAGAPDFLYFGVVAGENPRARKLLTGGRLPGRARVRHLCGLTTYAIMLRRNRPPRVPHVDVQSATPAMIGEIVAFLRRHGPQRQLFPAYTIHDFTDGARLRDLAVQDVMVAHRGGHIVGVMADWDQSAYKQDIVAEYGTALRRLGPLYNVAASIIGIQPLTRVGEAIPTDFAACVCVENEDLGVMRALLWACAQRARQRGKAFLMLGLADHDPLLRAGWSYPHLTYHSDLYAASWSDEPLSRLDERTPYVEIAAL